MIEFAKGHKLDFCCASGALAFDGCGWPWEWPFRWLGLLDPTQLTVVARTVTMEPKVGNLSWYHPWTCVRPFLGGAVNAVGLTNPGIRAWIKDDYPTAKAKGYKVAASIRPTTPAEAFVMSKLLDKLELAYIEINLSCPNVSQLEVVDLREHPVVRILDAFKSSRHSIVIKMSHEQVMDKYLLKAVIDHVIPEAIHAINTVPWNKIYPDQTSPVEYWTGKPGGVSGQPIKEHALKAIRTIKAASEIPVIGGGGGIWTYEDVKDFEKAGADAFSIGALFMHHPTRPNRIIEQYRACKASVK